MITSKSCSEDGLSDASSVLIRLSNIDQNVNREIDKLLLTGAAQLGDVVCQQIM